MPNFSLIQGDGARLKIPMKWEGRPFVLGATDNLIFTAKRDPSSADDATGNIQKTINGYGIEIEGTTAIVSLVYADTSDLIPGPLFFDLQAQALDGSPKTVATGRIEIAQGITQELEVTVPIVTTEPPIPHQIEGPPGPANTLEIGTVTTGSPGSAAAASITGTAPNQTLNLTLPAGETGGPGEPGPPGTTDYNDLDNVPTEFPPSAHDQAISTITGLQTALDGKAASSHTHDSLVSADGTTLVKVGTDYTGSGGGNTGIEIGSSCTASGPYSHAQGVGSIASGNYSNANGRTAVASGNYSHAEGFNTTASGSSSHAEGVGSTASGNYSHAEGASSTASGAASHAEGYYSVASGDFSRAAGVRAKAIHEGASVETDAQDADCESTAANQKTFRFAGGFRFLQGIADFFAGIGTNSKTTPIDADSVVINDSAASSEAKKLTFANLWTWIKSKMETASGILLPLTNGGTGATTAKGAVTKLTTVVDDANTTIALSATNDTGYIKRCTAGTAIGITTPSTDPGDGWSMMFIQAGAGKITFNPYSGSTINSYGNLTKTAGQHAVASLVRVSANTYNLSGNLA